MSSLHNIICHMTYRSKCKIKKKNHIGCDLMVGVFVLYLKRNGSSDSPNKACVVHVILPIAVTWREVDEPTLKTPYCEVNKRKKQGENALLVPIFWAYS